MLHFKLTKHLHENRRCGVPHIRRPNAAIFFGDTHSVCGQRKGMRTRVSRVACLRRTAWVGPFCDDLKKGPTDPLLSPTERERERGAEIYAEERDYGRGIATCSDGQTRPYVRGPHCVKNETAALKRLI